MISVTQELENPVGSSVGFSGITGFAPGSRTIINKGFYGFNNELWGNFCLAYSVMLLFIIIVLIIRPSL